MHPRGGTPTTTTLVAPSLFISCKHIDDQRCANLNIDQLAWHSMRNVNCPFNMFMILDKQEAELLGNGKTVSSKATNLVEDVELSPIFQLAKACEMILSKCQTEVHKLV
jgi:hypothetical protein